MPYLHERRIYLNRRHLDNQFYTIKRHKEQTFIQCMCFDLTKMYVYTETGKLVERYVYADEARTWGKPQTMSEDGSFILFRRSERSFIFDLIQVSINKFAHVLAVDLRSHLEKHLKSADEIFERKQVMSFWDTYLQRLQEPEDVRVQP
jgi:hypothetical protein